MPKNVYIQKLFVYKLKFPHTKHDKLGYYSIHYTHDTDYQIQSRNKIELRKSSKYYVIYHSLLLFDMIRWLLVYAVYL